MKKPEAGKGHDHAVFVGSGDHGLIPRTAAGLHDEFHPVSGGVVKVVPKGKKSVGSERHAAEIFQPLAARCCGNRLRGFGEERAPRLELRWGHVAFKERDAGIGAVHRLDLWAEGQVPDLRMLPQPPGVSLAPGELRAVNPALLSCTNADHLAVHRVAHRIRLRVLARDCRQHQVSCRLRGQVRLCRDALVQQGFGVEWLR